MGGPSRYRRQRGLAGERQQVAERLRGQRAEIEDAIGARALAVAEITGAEEPGYREGLRGAIAAAVDHALESVERGADQSGPAPAATLMQARAAARSGVELAVVLRRYAAGYSVLGDALSEELRELPAAAPLFPALQGELTAIFDRLITEVSAEYQREAERLAAHSGGHKAAQIRRLLNGERIGSAELGYELSGWHIAVVVSGADAPTALRRLIARFERPSLILAVAEVEAWAWIGGRERLDPAKLVARAEQAATGDLLFGVGEPSRGLSGWRSTHRQAQAACAIAQRDPWPVTRYGDVALISSVLDSEDLVRYLSETYLAPLASGRGSGEALRGTLRTYLAAGQNASSAAAALGVARQTVTARIRAVEERLERPIESCAAELEVALRIVPFIDADFGT
jgi:hypothetical protein